MCRAMICRTCSSASSRTSQAPGSAVRRVPPSGPQSNPHPHRLGRYHRRMRNLSGRTIALLESRRNEELAALVRRLGGTPVSAPSVREVPRDDDFGVFIDGLAGGRFSAAIFLTGAGANALFAEAERQGRLQEALNALRPITLACRGPKPLAALKRHGLIAQITTVKPHTTRELLEALEAVDLV